MDLDHFSSFLGHLVVGLGLGHLSVLRPGPEFGPFLALFLPFGLGRSWAWIWTISRHFRSFGHGPGFGPFLAFMGHLGGPGAKLCKISLASFRSKVRHVSALIFVRGIGGILKVGNALG